MNQCFIPNKFNIDTFYDTLLPLCISSSCDIIDMRKCVWIENEVIPNLLILGEIIKARGDNPPIIFLPKDGESVKRIKSYLQSINFTKLAQWYDLYETCYIENSYEEEPNRVILPNYCITRSYYSGEDIKNRENAIISMLKEIQYVHSNIFRNHLSKFDYLTNEKNENGELVYRSRNYIQDFVVQLIENSIMHGKGKVYFSMQGNKYGKTCTFTVSDNGIGIDRSMKEKVQKGEKLSLYASDTFLKLTERQMRKTSCVEAFAYRYDRMSQYGLFNVMSEIFKLGGALDVHTGDMRLIFTSQCRQYISDVDSRGSFAMGLMNYLSDYSENVRDTAFFSGTHISISIPTEKKDGWHVD